MKLAAWHEFLSRDATQLIILDATAFRGVSIILSELICSDTLAHAHASSKAGALLVVLGSIDTLLIAVRLAHSRE